MRSALLAVGLLACGESATSSIVPADAGRDSELPPFDCCVDGKDCTTGEPIRWCAPADAGPSGEGCKQATLRGCYMRDRDGGAREIFSTNHLAPPSTRPPDVVECDSDARAQACTP